MTTPSSDEALEALAGAHVAQICDCLDAVGYTNQCLPFAIEPLDRSMRFVGRAFAVQAQVVEEPPTERYRGLLAALDDLGRNDVYVISAGGDVRAALWGELVATSARARGAVATVTDGTVRDAAQLMDMGFPTFGVGTTPADIHGRYEVVSFGESLSIGGVDIKTGDLIAGDIDGVVVVPRHVEAEVISMTRERMVNESGMREVLAQGVPPSKAFEDHGVL